MIGSLNDCMCLERLEEAKVVGTAGRMKVVPYKSDSLVPVESGLCIGHRISCDGLLNTETHL
jgi:hypothetical protein